MQFLLDMGISPRTAEHLRARGHEALHLREENLERLADPDILQKARREERILLAHDLDFGDLLAASGAALPSVVTFRLHDMRPASVNRHVQRVLDEHRETLQGGAMFSVTEGHVRWRTLPIDDG